ncbi:putative ABC transport system permease protein [Pontibacter ummariensis]|uniref:Putative ABC transport system permease protein n=1 Tax=Pontibacter ummariensis TaxID=1610492 RepID=A0A239KB03_9BACT|nr:ABC transporter permease [Pontibacter ummariensis]PRY06066.1 putative ABC transport system permease protein [Pontibacter ummariensis]SNT14809.1 putative ABC transport system permease protein [Pontibacter ummariensis]
MIDIDKWTEIYNTVKKHKLRTGLTAFGVFWGIFMLVVLLGAGKGLENGIVSEFNIAKNAVFVWTQRTSVPYMGLKAGRFIQITNDDVAAIKANIPEVGVVAPNNQLGGDFTVNYEDKSSAFTVNGESPEVLFVRPLTITGGRFVNEIDMREKRKVAVVGPRVLEVLFPGVKEPIGEYISIKGSYFQIVGTFEPVGKGEDIVEDAKVIYIPHTALQQTFNQVNKVGSLALVPKPGVPAAVIEDKVKTLLMQRHQVAPTDLKAFGSANVEEEFQDIQGLFAGIAGFSWLVSIGTIIAGIIGVSNIMLIVVKERTKEIGIRKALGATPWSIISLIIQESIVITGLAGYVGLLGGTGIIALIEYLMRKFDVQAGFFGIPEVNPGIAITATVLLVITGALAGLIPATKAARVNPVVALKDE